ncbi:MAG: hypothetical protein OEZ16_11610 [Chromatiales bacterium]|nr:hypothetical protein [Chromatiales bacterium]
MSRHLMPLVLLVLSVFSLSVHAGELLPGTAIRGVEANPRVTFIVPWQRSGMREFPLMPSHSALDDFYNPLSSVQLELDLKIDNLPVAITK